MAAVTQAMRKVFAKSGIAMPDGSYYIRNAKDLENAINTVGLGNKSNPAIRKHIIKRAKALNLTKKLPDSWNSDGTAKHIDAVDDILAHHGVLGMKWGVRKDRSSGESSSDASRAKTNAAKAKSSGTHTLSNDDLQHLVTRMNLEKQYSSLKPASTADKAGKFIASTLSNVAKQQATKIAADVLAKQVASKLK